MTGSYTADVTARECWNAVNGGQASGGEQAVGGGQASGGQDAFLIDVRTKAEWAYVGVPVLGDGAHAPLFVEWQTYPSMAVDAGFAETVAAAVEAKGGNRRSSLYFLCRSGVRSMASAAALTQAGFAACYNVLDGFEGPVDARGHRGAVAGWKAEGLPWGQR